MSMFDPSIEAHYNLDLERPRLARDSQLEWVRTRELLERHLPAPPASVLDVGGGPGVYAGWLAGRGYAVRLIDPIARHVAEAEATSQEQPLHPFTAALGDARRLEEPNAAYDAVLLMGPLYHLVERSDRLLALREARRVVRPGGCVVAVGISRFASLLDGLRSGWLGDPVFSAIAEQDLKTGQHRNPEPDRRPEWFTTAYLHRPDELAEEVAAAGLLVEGVLGIEGPGWLIWRDLWDDPQQRAHLLDTARAVERESALLGASAHLMVDRPRPGVLTVGVSVQFENPESMSRLHPVGASIVSAPIPGEDRSNAHDLPGRRGIDLHAVADIDANVRDARLVRVREEDEVAGLWVADRPRRIELVDRNTWQTNSQRRVDVLHQTTTVHASPRATPEQIRHSKPRPGQIRMIWLPRSLFRGGAGTVVGTSRAVDVPETGASAVRTSPPV